MIYYDEFGNEYANVEEFIGESYLQWIYNKLLMLNRVVFIQTPTGSGKSYFVYKDLLAYAVEHGEKILYLVNRKILKKQIQREAEAALNDIKVKKNSYDMVSYIEVETYQYLENSIVDKGQNWGNNFLSRFQYIIMDEAHYFLQDSTYNTSNYWSFDAIMSCHRAVRIFMSATMNEIKEFYANTYKKYVEACGVPYNDAMKPIEYQLHLNYNYIRPHVFSDYDEIAKRIVDEDNDDKWFIVVDSKDTGKGLKKSITKKVNKANAEIREQNKCRKDNKIKEIVCDTVFIDAEYEEQQEAVKAVTEIVMENAYRAKVVIATIVLDNGVSIKDENLRKLVVVTDSKAELFQIIGRKRVTEGEIIDLYLVNGNRDTFKGRLGKVEACLKVAEEIESIERNYGSTIDTVLPKILNSEKYFDLCSNMVSYDKGRRELFVNLLSKMQLLYMRENYKEILKAFDEDEEFGFFNLQMKWLGIRADEEKEKYSMDLQAQLRQKVITALDVLVDKEYSREEANIQKETYRLALYKLFKKYCVENSAYTKENESIINNYLYKNSDAIPEDKFNVVMKALAFDYRMEAYRKGMNKFYVIRKC